MTLLGETAHVIAGNGFHKLVHRAESCRGINASLGLGDEASRCRSRVLSSRSQRLENRADRRGVGSSGKLARWIPSLQFNTESKLSIFDSIPFQNQDTVRRIVPVRPVPFAGGSCGYFPGAIPGFSNAGEQVEPSEPG